MNNKRFYSCLMLLWGLSISLLQAFPSDYYTGLSGKKGDAITEALYKKIGKHAMVSYKGLWNLYKTSDTKDGYIVDIYSTCSFVPGEGQCTDLGCSSTCSCYTREHTVPRSWFDGADGDTAYSDAFHVMPASCYVNGERLNYPYGECKNGDGFGEYGLGRMGNSSFSGYTNIGTVFEPDDEYKGDIARNYFYMVTCYRHLNFTQDNQQMGRKVFTWTNGQAGLTPYAIALFLKWHRQDPVSEKEIKRNNAIYPSQLNRNPYIDYPCLAEYIWGKYSNKALVLDSLLSTSSSDYPSYDTTGCTCRPVPAKMNSPMNNSSQVVGTAEIMASTYRDIKIKGTHFSQSVEAVLSGGDSAYFSLSDYTLVPDSLAKGYVVRVTYAPLEVGKHSTSLRILSVELTKPYQFTLTGEAVLPSSLPTTPYPLPTTPYPLHTTPYTKFIEKGQLYLLRDGQKYDLLGKKVK